MYHTPALLEQCIEALAIKPDGIYVDVTFGGGGHSREILKHLTTGRLVAFDRDADALQNIEEDERLTLVPHDFIHIKNYLRHLNALPVNGILADLGISSHQVDSEERGFSFRYDAPLDMRMDVKSPVMAKDILNNWKEADLQKLFSEYGEIQNARTLAYAIVSARGKAEIETTSQLASIAQSVMPHKETLRKYLAPVFQALRIEVNDEIRGLEHFLTQADEVLAPGGRLAIITYHSLEDRPVKNFFQTGNIAGKETKDIFGNAGLHWRQITRKPILPDEAEIERNPRVRSAKLRVGEKFE